MPNILSLKEFISAPGVILDVRSPSEYLQGQIPSSNSLPLFSDHERALVGTAYKKQGQQEAIDLGLSLIGPNLAALVKQARNYIGKGQGKILCWRGGMRSAVVARLLETIGMPTVTLKGGYKTFRRQVLSTFDMMPQTLPTLKVLGGFTGCAKTEILQELRALGEQVIDLESFACHRGSAFGGVDKPPQISNEQFENLIAWHWNQFDMTKPIWIEDESRLIGRCFIPSALHMLMQTSPLICIQRPLEERIQNIINMYASAPREELIAAATRLRKRMGSQLNDEVIALYNQDRLTEALTKLLSYYDKAYNFQMTRRANVKTLEGSNRSAHEWAVILSRSV